VQLVRAATLMQALTLCAFIGAGGPGQANADEGSGAGSAFDNIEIVDESLNGQVAILRVGSQPEENGLLTVFAGLKNATGHRLDLEVETIYKDQSGNDLNAASWIPLTFKPHEEKSYRSASISSRAVDFLIRVRSEKR